MDDIFSIDPVQQKKDNEHLNLLAIFYFVYGGLQLLVVVILFLFSAFFRRLLMNPEMWENSRQSGPPPEEFVGLFAGVFIAIGAFILFIAILNVLSGMFLRQKRNRLFSLIIAGFDCLNIPFGTALGIFTIMVLTRDSVKNAYINGDS